MTENVWVLVETIETFRVRYMVQAPADHPEYALDSVAMDTAKQFSQLYTGDHITDHRIVSEQEAIKMCDIDNDYSMPWDDNRKINCFFTKIGESSTDD